MSLQFTVSDMACSACAATITKAVTALDPTATVTADLPTKQVCIESQQPEAVIKSTITAAGYTIAP
ncbi:MAG: heavy-metal-associated domain-containing protein [Thermosynechococcaceae cyanobacterium]